MLRVLKGLFLCLLLVAACGESLPEAGGARILALGDSLLAANRGAGASVADGLEKLLGQPVVDRSVPGARFLYGLPISGAAGLHIPSQLRPGPWNIVVLNGGGNDLLFGCGCGQCSGVLDRLISRDGRAGAIPAFVKALRDTGARVVYLGYLRNPGVKTPIKACGPAGNELDRRLAALDRLDPGMAFVPLSDLVPHGDTSLHQPDLIHPSAKGSALIAARLAAAIKALPAALPTAR